MPVLCARVGSRSLGVSVRTIRPYSLGLQRWYVLIRLRRGVLQVRQRVD